MQGLKEYQASPSPAALASVLAHINRYECMMGTFFMLWDRFRHAKRTPELPSSLDADPSYFVTNLKLGGPNSYRVDLAQRLRPVTGAEQFSMTNIFEFKVAEPKNVADKMKDAMGQLASRTKLGVPYHRMLLKSPAFKHGATLQELGEWRPLALTLPSPLLSTAYS